MNGAYSKINFTVGPVMMEERIRQFGQQQLPYFRTEEFSALMKENDSMIKELFEASEKSQSVFLTTSGTGAMEAAVINCFDIEDRVLIVNGGGFGERFVTICNIYKIPYEEIKVDRGKSLRKEQLEIYIGKGYTGLLINMHETTTGVLYDMELVGSFCKENKLFLVVDAISSFLADDIHMKKWNINVIFTGSQKALALPPGMAIIVVDEQTKEKLRGQKCKSLYFDFSLYLSDGKRGQTPFTPAVGILIQLNERLKEICKEGICKEKTKIQMLAMDFRKKIKPLPFSIESENMSWTLTPLRPMGKMDAYDIFVYLENHYGIWVCPSGGEFSKQLLRVGHIGDLTITDNDKLIEAWMDMQKRGIL